VSISESILVAPTRGKTDAALVMSLTARAQHCADTVAVLFKIGVTETAAWKVLCLATHISSLARAGNTNCLIVATSGSKRAEAVSIDAVSQKR
jgi:hypothetical protein